MFCQRPAVLVLAVFCCFASGQDKPETNDGMTFNPMMWVPSNAGPETLLNQTFTINTKPVS